MTTDHAPQPRVGMTYDVDWDGHCRALCCVVRSGAGEVPGFYFRRVGADNHVLAGDEHYTFVPYDELGEFLRSESEAQAVGLAACVAAGTFGAATISAAPQWFPTHMLRVALRKNQHATSAVEVLQQWWHCHYHPAGKKGEWRDVPKAPDADDQTPPATVHA